MKKLIKNGTIVLEDKVIQGDLLIEDEVIAAIGQDLEADGGQVIDASGMVYCRAELMCTHILILMWVYDL